MAGRSPEKEKTPYGGPNFDPRAREARGAYLEPNNAESKD